MLSQRQETARRVLHAPDVRAKNLHAVIAAAHARLGIPNYNIRGDKHHGWLGGTSDRTTDMGRIEYKIWRFTVFKRDNFKCVICNNKEIQAHHISRWKDDKENRYCVSNGITICKTCHRSIKSKEPEYADLFASYILTAKNTTITIEELARLQPITVNCNNCGLELHRPRRDRFKSAWFCNNSCRLARKPATS